MLSQYKTVMLLGESDFHSLLIGMTMTISPVFLQDTMDIPPKI